MPANESYIVYFILFLTYESYIVRIDFLKCKLSRAYHDEEIY